MELDFSLGRDRDVRPLGDESGTKAVAIPCVDDVGACRRNPDLAVDLDQLFSVEWLTTGKVRQAFTCRPP